MGCEPSLPPFALPSPTQGEPHNQLFILSQQREGEGREMLSTVTGQTPSLSLQTSQEISGESLRLPAESSVPPHLPNMDPPRAERDRTGKGSGGGVWRRARPGRYRPGAEEWRCWKHIRALHSRELRNPTTPEGTSLATSTPHSKSVGLQGENTRAAPCPEPNFALKNLPVRSRDGQGSPGAREPEQDRTGHTHLPARRSGPGCAQRRSARTAPQQLRERGRLMVRGRPPRDRRGWSVRTAFRSGSRPARRRQARL
ncbi:hypothetical protein NN561_001699 [Cricetulus griseus]